MQAKSLSALSLAAAILGFLAPTSTTYQIIPSLGERFSQSGQSIQGFCSPSLVYKDRIDHAAQAYDECIKWLESHPVGRSQHRDTSVLGNEDLEEEARHLEAAPHRNIAYKENSQDDPIFSAGDDFSVEKPTIAEYREQLAKYAKTKSEKGFKETLDEIEELYSDISKHEMRDVFEWWKKKTGWGKECESVFGEL